MTVSELRNHLSRLDGETQVAVSWENPENEVRLFDINEISMHRGTPSRDAKGRPAFAFDGKGPVNWLFMDVSHD